VGLRLPKYLLDDLDDFTKLFSLNKSEIITEAVKSYIQAQKDELFYDNFNTSAQELKKSLNSDNGDLQTLDGLINEFNNI